MSGKGPRTLLVTSDGASPAAVTPVLAALEAAGLRLRAIDVGRVGSRADGALDRIIRTLVGEFAERRLMKELGTYPPDVVVVFDPGTAAALTAVRDQATKPAPVVAVIDALSPNREWAATDADRYLVVDDEAAVALADHEVEGERILPIGAISEASYADAASKSRAELRQRFKLGSGLVVLVDVDGLGYDATSQVALQLSLSESRATYLFDAGSDSDAATALRRQVPTLGMAAKLFGDTQDAPLYWRCADVIVARPQPRNVARALVLGARFVALLPEDKSGQAVANALGERAVGVAASNALLLTSALEQLLKSGKVSDDLVAADGAANVADVVWIVGSERAGVIDERHVAARAATRERVKAATAAADAAERVSATAGGLEDLSGGVAYAEPDFPDAGEVARLRAEVNTRIGQVSKTVFAAREAAEQWDNRREKARKKGDDELAREAERNADGERARMHQSLAELSQLQSELKGLERAAATASASSSSPRRAASTASPSPPRPPKPSVDDLLDKMKREQRGGTLTSTTKKKRKKKKRPADTLDDELAALKRKMAAKEKKSR